MNLLEYAIKMEADGAQYYAKQAETNKGNSLYTVCTLLAKEELRHEQILKNKAESLSYSLDESTIKDEVKTLFDEMDDFKNELKKIPSQLDFYRFALENEQKSIDLYTEFAHNAANDEEKKLFEYLVEQEKEHYAIVDEFVKILTHAEQWVESAEFGVREDY